MYEHAKAASGLYIASCKGVTVEPYIVSGSMQSFDVRLFERTLGSIHTTWCACSDYYRICTMVDSFAMSDILTPVSRRPFRDLNKNDISTLPADLFKGLPASFLEV